MTYEAGIRFRVPPRKVILADPTRPLPVPPPGAAKLPTAVPPPPDPQRRLAEERQAIERVLASMMEVAQHLEAQQRQNLSEMQQATVELAMAVASRLIHDKVAAGNHAVENLVQQVVERLPARQSMKVYLHPEDLALLKQRVGSELTALAGGREVQWIADPAVGRGDCRADSGEVSILSQLEVQLGDLRRHLLGALDHAEIERRKASAGDSELRRFPDRRQTA